MFFFTTPYFGPVSDENDDNGTKHETPINHSVGINKMVCTSEFIKTTAFETLYYSDEAMTVLHREDGAAVEDTDGYKEWRLNGELHREDGPAVEATDDHKEWWIDGKLHREDGPAIEYATGHKEWWIDGESVNEDGTPYVHKELKQN